MKHHKCIICEKLHVVPQKVINAVISGRDISVICDCSVNLIQKVKLC
jgi:hypothetical protein